MLALLGLLAVAGYQNRDKLGDMLGRVTGGSGNPLPGGGSSANSGLGGMLGNLGGLLSGGTTVSGLGSGGLSGALGDLVSHFQNNGHGDAANSWVSTGPNRDVAPTQLESALGEDTIQQLSQHTGLSRQELLSRLTSVLPSAVDKLTPQGRLPTSEEATSWTSRM